MNYWLMKSEPNCFSIDDLKKVRVEAWDGVRNYQVRNMFRDDFRVGDRALFYHSNAGNETGIVGEMEVVSEAYPDPTQFDPKSEHSDPTSDPDNPQWLLVDVKFVRKFKHSVYLKDLKLDPAFADMSVVQKGNRLSVMPVKKKHYSRLIKLVI